MIVTFAYPFINGRAIIWVKNTNFPDDYSCCSEKLWAECTKTMRYG